LRAYGGDVVAVCGVPIAVEVARVAKGASTGLNVDLRVKRGAMKIDEPAMPARLFFFAVSRTA
jgi:hypothetical protein